jgi:hypothetical protein
MISLFLLVVLIAPLLSVEAYAEFNPVDPACQNANGVNSELCNPSPDDPITRDEGILVTVANVLSIVAGIIAVIVLIVAGITMMTSGGDAGKVAKSRSAIIYTAIGLVVVIASRTIVVFVFSRFI